MQKSGRLLFLGLAALLVAASGLGQSAPKKRMRGTPQPAKAVAKALPNTYGTDIVSYYRIGAAEFTAMEIGADSQTDYLVRPAGRHLPPLRN